MSLQAVVCEPSRTGLLLLEQGIKFKTKSMGSVLTCAKVHVTTSNALKEGAI